MGVSDCHMEQGGSHMQVEGLDDLDNKILSVIEKDARKSYSDIGDIVGVSRVCMKNRMRVLEEKGYIQGYYTRIDPDSASEGIRFFLEVTTHTDQFENVTDRIASKEVIRRVYSVTGECRLMVEGFAPSRSKYELFMRNLKHNLDGVKSIIVMNVEYVIKDSYAGVDYVSPKEQAAMEDPG